MKHKVERCGNCRFFLLSTSEGCKGLEVELDWKPRKDKGFCRKNAPTCDNGFPEIYIGQWCGDYERKED